MVGGLGGAREASRVTRAGGVEASSREVIKNSEQVVGGDARSCQQLLAAALGWQYHCLVLCGLCARGGYI